MLEPTPSDELIPGRHFLDIDNLRNATKRAVTAGGSVVPPGGDENAVAPPEDLARRIAASRFTRHYSSALTLTAVVGLSRGIGVDLSVDRCTGVVRHNLIWGTVLNVPDQHVLRCAQRQAEWQIDGPVVDTVDELRQYVWRKLYAEHLGPLFERLAEIEGVAPSGHWTDAADHRRMRRVARRAVIAGIGRQPARRAAGVGGGRRQGVSRRRADAHVVLPDIPAPRPWRPALLHLPAPAPR